MCGWILNEVLLCFHLEEEQDTIVGLKKKQLVCKWQIWMQIQGMLCNPVITFNV